MTLKKTTLQRAIALSEHNKVCTYVESADGNGAELVIVERIWGENKTVFWVFYPPEHKESLGLINHTFDDLNNWLKMNKLRAHEDRWLPLELDPGRQ